MGTNVLRPAVQFIRKEPMAVPGDGIPRAFRLAQSDIESAFHAGLADFLAVPRYGLMFGGAFVLAGLAILAALVMTGNSYLVFPAFSGFLLVAPFLTIGLYEVSRRRSLGLPLHRRSIIFAFNRHGGSQIGILGLALITGATLWMKLAVLLYALFFGMTAIPIETLFQTVFTTASGIEFAVIGSIIGFVMAATVFSTCLFALPMMLDRDVDVVTAVIASVRAVSEQPRLYLGWAAMVAMLSTIGLLTVIGLPFVMAVLGHATWHLYTSAFGQTDLAD